MENLRNRIILEFIKKHEYKKSMKQESKLIFAGLHKTNENCDSYSFEKIEVKMDRPIYLGYAALELSKLHMYET